MHIIDGVQYANAAEIRAAIQRLDDRARGRSFTTAERDQWNRLNASLEEVETEARRDRLREFAQRPEMLERIDNRTDTVLGGASSGRRSRSAAGPGGAAHERALGVVDRFTRSGVLSAAAADRLDAHVRQADPLGLDSRYLAAVGAPEYASAFAKIMADPTNGHLRFEPKEVAAMRAVARVEAERAALEGGTGNLGGFALPIEVDPTVLLSSSGEINPIRDLATVRTISTREWTGVSSDGVVASYDAELEEVSDDSPTFGQPRIVTAMGRAFVQASLELMDDWGSIVAEMTKLFSDARDVLDATAFLTGSGTDEPEGILTGLSASEKVETAGSGAFVLGDVYKLKQAVPDRWKGSTTIVGHSDTMDTIYTMVGLADPSEAMAMEGRAGDLLGRRKAEWNTMGTGVVAGTKVLIAGDVKTFVIADRIGSSVELIPHILGANRLPIGARGLFYRWRSGSTVTVPNALRFLQIKA